MIELDKFKEMTNLTLVYKDTQIFTRENSSALLCKIESCLLSILSDLLKNNLETYSVKYYQEVLQLYRVYRLVITSYNVFYKTDYIDLLTKRHRQMIDQLRQKYS